MTLLTVLPRLRTNNLKGLGATLTIEKLRRQIYGSRSEHKARLLEQMELSLKIWKQPQPKTNWRLSVWSSARDGRERGR